jgi:hypothetical protein
MDMGNKVRNLIKSLVAIGVALTMLTAGAPTALARVVDRNVTAGVQTSPDTSWLSKVSGCTKYVAEGGNDTTGTGELAKAWKTIKVGASKLQQLGETLCVEPGTYHEANIVPAVLGTFTRPTAIKALGNPADVKILPATTSTSGSEDSFFTIVTNALPEIGYLLIENFTMDKEKHDGPGFYLLGSGNGIHHVVIQNNVIMNSKTHGITVRGRSHNILIKKNTITGHSRWVLTNKTDPQYTPTSPNHRRFDANAVEIEGTDLPKSVETVRIEGNIMKNNGGDGVQCLGVKDDKTYSGDPTDIDILDNRVQKRRQ